MENKNIGEEFLEQKYWSNKKFREAAEKTAERTKTREGKSVPNEPEALIENYLKRFTDIFEREDEQKRERGVKSIKRLLHRKYIIKPENISDEYIKGVLFGNFVEQKGYNRGDLKNPDIKQELIEQFNADTGYDFEDYSVPEKERNEIIEMVIKDQTTRLNSWFDYLTGPEAEENIPAAYRYWTFAEMLKLGSYDDERQTYNKRAPNTVTNFPELDQQALALVLDEIRAKQKNETSQLVLTEKKDQDEFRKRLDSENFGKLYGFTQEYLKSLRLPTEQLTIIKGKWKVFPKGSDAGEIAKALSGFHTQWCIAGEGTAQGYLSHSDLHIYFSQDQEGKNTIPRACIVDSKERGITEVRGTMSDETSKQHLDDYITPVVDEHLASMGGGEKWRDTMQDMKQLANIHIKSLQGEELLKDDLRFLYEIDKEIHSTGFDRDPRIAQILKGRDIKEDLSLILNTSKDKISTTQEEALSGDIVFHYGDLNLDNLTSAEGLELPESIGGSLYLGRLTSAAGLKLPKSISGDLYLGRLTSAAGLKLPESISGGLYLDSLTSAEGLELPESISGDLDLGGLTSAEGLKLPESIGGYLDLGSLTSAAGLKLPESISGGLYLGSLTSAAGLELPESIGGDLDLRSLTSAAGLELPESIGGNLRLDNLTSAAGLKLPKSIGGDLYLDNLTSATRLELPESIGGSIRLGSLTSAEKEVLISRYPHLASKIL